MSGYRRLVAGIENLDEAKADARTARARLIGTVEEIQARIAPSNLLDDALTGLRTRSADLAESAGRAARQRPGAIAAVAAGVALLLARKPIARLGGKLFRRGEETPDADRKLHP